MFTLYTITLVNNDSINQENSRSITMNSSTVTGKVAEYNKIWRLLGRNEMIRSNIPMKS